MKVNKKRNIVEIIIAIIIGLSVINYNIINEDTAHYVEAETVSISNDKKVEYDGNQIIDGQSECIYRIGTPKTEVKYSKSYNCQVYRYIIPFYAKNNSQTSNAEVTIDQSIRVYSAGNIWESLPRKNLDSENDLNDNTKWTLKPGEYGKGYAIVDVVIDEIHTEEKLKKFKIYSVSRLRDKIYRYEIDTEK